MVKIALIDSGADIVMAGINSMHVSGTRIYKDEWNEIRFEEGNIHDTAGHGTKCLSILSAYAPDELYCIVKIFDDQLITDAKVMAAAINYCIAANADVINISSGIASIYIPDELAEACDLAYSRNIIIVAAAHNQLRTSFPACYPTVIGVGNVYLDSEEEIIFQQGSAIEFYTCDHPPGDKFFVTYGSSFSCPKITGLVAQLIKAKGRIGFAATRQSLISLASAAAPPPHIMACKEQEHHEPAWYTLQALADTAAKYLLRHKKFDKVNKVLVAPLNDAGFSRLHQLDMASLSNGFRLTGSFEQHHPAVLPDIFIRKPSPDVDTIALGQITEYIFPGNQQMVYRGLRSLLQLGKNFMVFDERSAFVLDAVRSAICTTSRIYAPTTQKQLYEHLCRFRFLPDLKIPVLAVAGTGNRPMVSLQVQLKKALELQGYQTEYISPVPQGDLIEACFSFPLVYWENKHTAREMLTMLRSLLRGIQEFCKPDIIVTGLVDRVVPASNNSMHSWCDNANFLQAIQPDALVLAIDEHSNLPEVEENSYAAAAYARAPVIAYLVQSENVFHRWKHFFRGKQVVIGHDAGAADAIAKAVEDFFALEQEPVHQVHVQKQIS